MYWVWQWLSSRPPQSEAPALFHLSKNCIGCKTYKICIWIFPFKGYGLIPSHVGSYHLRRVRGDNYCAIRAALFQALVDGIPLLASYPSKQDVLKVSIVLRAPLGESLHAGWTCMHTNSNFQIYPAASTEILHYTTWRTWLFIASLVDKWLCYQFLSHHIVVYIPLQKVKGRMYALNLGVKGPKVNLQGSARANSTWVTCKIVTITLRCNIPCQESM